MLSTGWHAKWPSQRKPYNLCAFSHKHQVWTWPWVQSSHEMCDSTDTDSRLMRICTSYLSRVHCWENKVPSGCKKHSSRPACAIARAEDQCLMLKPLYPRFSGGWRSLTEFKMISKVLLLHPRSLFPKCNLHVLAVKAAMILKTVHSLSDENFVQVIRWHFRYHKRHCSCLHAVYHSLDLLFCENFPRVHFPITAHVSP